jgi:hypothetical protein
MERHARVRSRLVLASHVCPLCCKLRLRRPHLPVCPLCCKLRLRKFVHYVANLGRNLWLRQRLWNARLVFALGSFWRRLPSSLCLCVHERHEQQLRLWNAFFPSTFVPPFAFARPRNRGIFVPQWPRAVFDAAATHASRL